MVVNSFIGRGNWSTQEKPTDRPQGTDKLLQNVDTGCLLDRGKSNLAITNADKWIHDSE